MACGTIEIGVPDRNEWKNCHWGFRKRSKRENAWTQPISVTFSNTIEVISNSKRRILIELGNERKKFNLIIVSFWFRERAHSESVPGFYEMHCIKIAEKAKEFLLALVKNWIESQSLSVHWFFLLFSRSVFIQLRLLFFPLCYAIYSINLAWYRNKSTIQILTIDCTVAFTSIYLRALALASIQS